MLTPDVVERAESMLDEGVPYRDIVKHLPVGRGTLGTIRAGKHAHQLSGATGRSRPRRCDIVTDGPIGRCSHCGRRAILPHRECLLELQDRHDKAKAKGLT